MIMNELFTCIEWIWMNTFKNKYEWIPVRINVNE